MVRVRGAELTYKDPAGKVANELLYRHDEPRIEVVEQGRPAGPGGKELSSHGKPTPTQAPKPKRFHGTVSLNPVRVGLDASRIADEVIAHLTALPNRSRSRLKPASQEGPRRARCGRSRRIAGPSSSRARGSRQSRIGHSARLDGNGE